MLRIVDPGRLESLDRLPFDERTLAESRAIVDDVRRHAEPALRRHAARFQEISDAEPLVIGRAELAAALRRVGGDAAALLERVAARIRAFARGQREALLDLDIPAACGRMGHRFVAVDRAGCYAPGGRFPLPSSVLMTAITARAAGVRDVIVASPRPTDITLAAAAVAGADGLLRIGGAQAIAALAYGVGVAACDVIVGPGNKWVTAAKHIVSAHVGIDMLAGPSELAVLADDSADPIVIAADLLAQAEHDADALPIVVATDASLIERINQALAVRIESLPTRATAAAALRNGFAVLVRDVSEGIDVCDRLAPEHLQVMVRDARGVAELCRNYGGIFIGGGSAEVFGDYGVGPNHTLPTGGTARFTAGLSVMHFLRARTWIDLDPRGSAYASLVRDTAALARLEGLEGHARAAEARLG